MSIIEQIVNIVGGQGGPNDNAIPVYSDNKAPNGGQVKGANGLQLMLENSVDSGYQYIMVDPDLLTKAENGNGLFLTYKADGSVNYAKLWVLNPETGHGEPYAPGVEMWVEYSHLKPADIPTPPQPPVPGNTSTFVIDWNTRTITLKPG
jgi:hypothetical protein